MKPALILLTGPNNFMLQAERQRFIKDFAVSHGDLAIERFEAEEVEPAKVGEAINNLPFLVDSKLVVINRPSQARPLTDKLEVWLEELAAGINVLLIDPAPDKRTRWYKFITKTAKVMNFPALDESALKRWLKSYVGEQGVVIEPAAAEELIRLVGIDQQLLAMEIDKLLPLGRPIDKALINKLVDPLPRETIFELLEALMSKRLDRAGRILDQLRKSGTDAMEILALIGWQIQVLALVAAASEQPGSSGGLGLHPFVVRKNQAVASRLGLKGVRRLADLTVQSELSVKKRGANAAAVLDVLIMKLSEI